MEKFRLFASIYRNTRMMLDSQIRDHALNLQNNSNIFLIEAESLDLAVSIYLSSQDYDNFYSQLNKEKIYIYYLDENGNPQPTG